MEFEGLGMDMGHAAEYPGSNHQPVWSELVGLDSQRRYYPLSERT